MTLELLEIARLRRRNQRLMGGRFESAVEAVGWLGAVQSQDYPLAKWSLGLRVRTLVDPDVDALLASASILRTHVLRPTWHFILPADLRWMMALTGPRIMRKGQPPGVAWPAPATVMRGVDAMGRALAGGNRLSRAQLAKLVVAQGIVATEMDTIPMFMTAELELVMVSGGLVGKVQTYALVDEVVPPGAAFEGDWALAELTRRYFTSHGPATVGDFVWWSGLTVADTRRGLATNAANGGALEALDVDGTDYWWAGDTTSPAEPDDSSPTAHYLQAYDEYIVAYRSPRTVVNIDGLAHPSVLQRPPLTHVLILDGQVVGFWRRDLAKNRILLETSLLTQLTTEQKRALAAAADRFGRFVGLPAEVSPATSRPAIRA